MTSRKIPRRLQQSLLGSIFELLADSGLDESEIRHALDAAFANSQKRAAARAQAPCARYISESDLAADLLRKWHRDSRYIDEVHAKPQALHLTRGRQSIRAMALELDPEADVAEVTRFLTRSGLIYRVSAGKYLPTNEIGAISHSEKFVAEHVVRSIIRFITTVRRNTKMGLLGQPMIERFAYVSDLNAADIQSFCEFTKAQGHSYLQVVDDWMEQRRVRKRGGRTTKQRDGVFAGLHIVAYVGDGMELGAKGRDAAPSRGSEGSDDGSHQRISRAT